MTDFPSVQVLTLCACGAVAAFGLVETISRIIDHLRGR